ncbi:MAG: hypothetical protein D6725_05330 [Planctomycetota bacterium]|nr:MAG: hypothetical protein D6725_05330 [Planctomycetota bacterium]
MLAAFALAGPVLLHLMRQRPRRVLVFSSLQFLHATPVRPRTRRRVDDWLLLALRLTAIGLLVAAFVRPVWHAHTLPANGPAPRHSILLDRSASMHRGDAWPAALAAVAAELKESPAGTSVEVLAFDATVEPLLTFEESSALPPPRRAAVVADRLRDRGPSHGPTRLDRALKHLAVRIAESLRSSTPSDDWTVTLVTDAREDVVLDELNGVAWPEDVAVAVRRVGGVPHPATGDLGTQAGLSAAPSRRTAPSAAAAHGATEADAAYSGGPLRPDTSRQPAPSSPADTSAPLRWQPVAQANAPLQLHSASPPTVSARINAVVHPLCDPRTFVLQRLVVHVVPETGPHDRRPRPAATRHDVSPPWHPRTLRIRLGPAFAPPHADDRPQHEIVVPIRGVPTTVPLPPLPDALDRFAALTATLDGDDVPFDNVCHIARPEAVPLRIALIEANAAPSADKPLSAGYFLRRACRASDGRLELTTDWPPADGSATTVSPDLVVVCGTPPTDACAATRRFIRRGGTALLLLDRNDRSTLETLTGRPGWRSEPVEDLDYVTWASRAPHPIWTPSGVTRPLDFTHVRFWRYIRIAGPRAPTGDATSTAPTAPPGVRTLARFESGDPALIEVRCGTGRLLVMAAGWTPDDGQLALSKNFVPLLVGLAEYAAGRVPRKAMFEIGEPIEVDMPTGGVASTPNPADVVIRCPDGRTVQCPLQPHSPTIRFEDAAVPGHYVVEWPSGRWIVAVNRPLAESTAAALEHDAAPRTDAPDDADTMPGAAGPRSASRSLVARLTALGIPVRARSGDPDATSPGAAPALGSTDGEVRRRGRTIAPADRSTRPDGRLAELRSIESRQRLWWWCVAAAVAVLAVETVYAAGCTGRRSASDEDTPGTTAQAGT